MSIKLLLGYKNRITHVQGFHTQFMKTNLRKVSLSKMTLPLVSILSSLTSLPGTTLAAFVLLFSSSSSWVSSSSLLDLFYKSNKKIECFELPNVTVYIKTFIKKLECKGWCLINQGVINLFFKELLIQHVIYFIIV